MKKQALLLFELADGSRGYSIVDAESINFEIKYSRFSLHFLPEDKVHTIESVKEDFKSLGLEMDRIFDINNKDTWFKDTREKKRCVNCKTLDQDCSEFEINGKSFTLCHGCQPYDYDDYEFLKLETLDSNELFKRGMELVDEKDIIESKIKKIESLMGESLRNEIVMDSSSPKKFMLMLAGLSKKIMRL